MGLALRDVTLRVLTAFPRSPRERDNVSFNGQYRKIKGKL